MWNDTDSPLAYLITFRCRGTWLHGDSRNSTDRYRNVYGTPHIEGDERWLLHNIKELKGEPLILDRYQRNAVTKAIKETCKFRGWDLFASNPRTNHVHAVVASGNDGSAKVLHALKANSTRVLREEGLWPHSYSPWADKGSKRYLWNQDSISSAINYVLYGQGDDFLYIE